MRSFAIHKVRPQQHRKSDTCHWPNGYPLLSSQGTLNLTCCFFRANSKVMASFQRLDCDFVLSLKYVCWPRCGHESLGKKCCLLLSCQTHLPRRSNLAQIREIGSQSCLCLPHLHHQSTILYLCQKFQTNHFFWANASLAFPCCHRSCHSEPSSASRRDHQRGRSDVADQASDDGLPRGKS